MITGINLHNITDIKTKHMENNETTWTSIIFTDNKGQTFDLTIFNQKIDVQFESFE